MNGSNVVALQAICSSIQTLLGPSKSLKCCLSADHSNDGLISDPLQLVDVLVGGVSGTHPIVHLVHEACLDQKKTCGCGTTTLVCMATYWARGIERLIREGIPPPVVFDMFEETLTLCENTLLTLSIPLKSLQPKTTAVAAASLTNEEITNAKSPRISDAVIARRGGSLPSSSTNQKRAMVMAYSRHFGSTEANKLMSEKEENDTQKLTSPRGVSGDYVASEHSWIEVVGERLCSGKSVAMRLAGMVAKLQLSVAKELQIRYIFHDSTLGKDQECSKVVQGTVLDLHLDMVPVVSKHQERPLGVVVVDGDCTPSHTHLGLQKRTQVMSYDQRQLYECSSKVKWLNNCTEVLRKLKVGVVVVSGAVSPLLWEYCLSNGIVILKGVAKQQLEGVCHLTGASPQSYLCHCLERHVGRHAVKLSAEEWGWYRPSVRLGGQRERHFERRYICTMERLSPRVSAVATVMLCGKTECMVNILEHQFLNCLHRLKLVHEEGFLLPGGGMSEAVCVSKLRHKLHEMGQGLTKTDLASQAVDEHEDSPNNMSFAMATSWMSDSSLLACWRPLVYEVCIEGLLLYIARVLINCSCSGSQYVTMAAAEELVKKVEERGGLSARDPKVLDVARSKMMAWRRALELLRLTFLSTWIHTP